MKIASIAAATALGVLAAPGFASAAAAPAHWSGVSSAHGVQWMVNDDNRDGGWCDRGQPNSSWVVRTTDGTTKKLTIEDYHNNGTGFTSLVRTITVTPKGTVYAGLGRGSMRGDTIKLWRGQHYGPDTNNPRTCAGLPNHLPANPWHR